MDGRAKELSGRADDGGAWAAAGSSDVEIWSFFTVLFDSYMRPGSGRDRWSVAVESSAIMIRVRAAFFSSAKYGIKQGSVRLSNSAVFPGRT